MPSSNSEGVHLVLEVGRPGVAKRKYCLIAQRELCEKVGKSRTTLRQYPRVNALLEQKITLHHVYQRRREQPEEEELVQRVKQAITDLANRGEHITPRKVAYKVKISRDVLAQYPQVVALLEQSGYTKRKPRSAREEELLELVREAIQACKVSGQPITKERLSSMVAVDRAALLRYPQVRAQMTQAANEDRQQRREMRHQEREEELTQHVDAALQQLRDQNRRITKQAVENLVHVSNICSYYPKVRVLLESAIAAQHAASKTAQN